MNSSFEAGGIQFVVLVWIETPTSSLNLDSDLCSKRETLFYFLFFSNEVH